MQTLDQFVEIDQQYTRTLDALKTSAPALMREYRKRHGMSVRLLAQRLGVSGMAITNFERGDTVSPGMLRRFAALLNEGHDQN